MRDDPLWLILGSDVHLGRNLGTVQTNRFFHQQSPTLQLSPGFSASTVSDTDCFLIIRNTLRFIFFCAGHSETCLSSSLSPFFLPYSINQWRAKFKDKVKKWSSRIVSFISATHSCAHMAPMCFWACPLPHITEVLDSHEGGLWLWV